MALNPFTLLQIQFLLLSTLIIVAVDTVVLAWLGKGGWAGALRGAALGVVPFYVVIALALVFPYSSLYREHLAWTMVFALPLLAFYGGLILACVVKAVIQSLLSGPAGAITCAFLMPVLAIALAGPGPSLWSMLESTREPLSMEDAVERGSTAYISRNLKESNAQDVLRLATIYLNATAAELAIDNGADPNVPVSGRSLIKRSPLAMALDRWETMNGVAYPMERRRDLVEVLLKRGADANAPSPKALYYSSSPDAGKTEIPWDIASAQPDSGKLTELLTMYGGRPAGARSPSSPASPGPASAPAAGAGATNKP